MLFGLMQLQTETQCIARYVVIKDERNVKDRC